MTQFYGKEPCPCGHPSCKKFFLTGIGSFVQGSGFSEEEADLILQALSALSQHAAGEVEAVAYQVRCLLPTGNHQWRTPVLPSELAEIRATGKDAAGIPYEVRALYATPQPTETQRIVAEEVAIDHGLEVRVIFKDNKAAFALFNELQERALRREHLAGEGQ